jgi:hypothetical protein
MSLSPVYTPPSLTDPDYRTFLRNRRRRGWVIAALILSQIAIALEALTHICASSFFDPMPDIATALAYALVVATLWGNERVLAAEPPAFIRRLGQKRATVLALAATTVSLIVAGMASYMFIPMLVFAVPLLIVGVGALLLVPMLDTVLLIIQLRTLLALWRTNETSLPDDGVSFAAFRAETRRVQIGTAIIAVAAVFWLIARPLLIGQYTARGLRSTDTSSTQVQAFKVLRFLHGEGTLLDLAYRRNPPYWVCLGYNGAKNGFLPWSGYNWNGGGFGNFYDEPAKARRTYYLLTGNPFESVPRPTSLIHQGGIFGGPDDVAIEETGGYVVGRPVPDLSLAQSEMHGIANPKTETAEYEWTMTFRNDSSQPQEARADVLLPPGGVGHAVSLWINGIEQQARFGSPQKVRAAYQEIAVVQRRDPLLVTMPAPDHLLVQCFPVPANGQMKIKIGITAPLRWQKNNDQKPELVADWPAFGPVNFDTRQSKSNVTEFRTVGVREIVTDSKDFFTPSPSRVIGGPEQRQSPKAGDILFGKNDEFDFGVVRVSDPLAAPKQPVDLIFVLDASSGMNALLKNGIHADLEKAIRSLPSGSRVITVGSNNQALSSMQWQTPEQALSGYLDRPSWFWIHEGGIDPAPVLALAVQKARREKQNKSAVVFLHAASPVNVSNLTEVRKQLQSDPDKGPALVGIQLAPHAQDAVMMDLAGFDRVYARRALPGDNNAVAEAIRFACQCAVSDAGKLVAERLPLGGHMPAIGGIIMGNVFTGDSASTAIADEKYRAYARLAQATRTTAGWYESNTLAEPMALDLRIEAGRPAAKARLVTPLSSAVVLETKEQYKKAGLDDDEKEKDKDAKPKANTASPEPGSLLLFGVGLTAAARIWYRRKKK